MTDNEPTTASIDQNTKAANLLLLSLFMEQKRPPIYFKEKGIEDKQKIADILRLAINLAIEYVTKIKPEEVSQLLGAKSTFTEELKKLRASFEYEKILLSLISCFKQSTYGGESWSISQEIGEIEKLRRYNLKPVM